MRTSRQNALHTLIIYFLFLSAAACAQTGGDIRAQYGYQLLDRDRAATSPQKQSGPAEFRVWLDPRVYFYADWDSFKAKKVTGQWTSGIGDFWLGTDVVAFQETDRRPEIDIDYSAKVPSAATGFGTGFVDHQFLISLVKTPARIPRHTLELDTGDYIAGLGNGKFSHSGLLSLSDEIGILGPHKSYTGKLIVEIDAASASTASDPTEAYANVKWKQTLSRHFTVIPGVRVGITPYTPRVGVYVTLRYFSDRKVR